ncbi:MAG: cyclase family protein [Proteobacteria bacterium]|nr:cyclase family protein [Pseudomonadota bacterium]
MAKRWKQRPEGSNWGEFGDDDQLGRLNLLTPAKRRQGIAEAKEGLAFCLSMPLDYPGGNVLNTRRFPPRLFATLRGDQPSYNHTFTASTPHITDVTCDDAALIYLQYSTQWDSFAHAGCLFDADGDGVKEIVYYNGWRGGEHVVGVTAASGVEPWARYEGVSAKKLGIENYAVNCIQGRGVLVDLHAQFGRKRQYVGYDDLMAAMRADKVEVEPGDMLLLYTGFDRVLLDLRRSPDAHTLENSCAVLNGRDAKLLQWITDSNVVALISDNYAVEAVPALRPAGDHERHTAAPIHQHCLFKLGVPLGEIWYLAELAQWLRAHKRSRFLLTAPPLRLPGAVGSPASPVATV